MAIWQVAFHFIFEKTLRFYDPVFQDSLLEFQQEFPEESSWSNTIRQYGKLDSTCMEIDVDSHGEVISICSRINLSCISKQQLELICHFAENNEFLIEYNDTLYEPTFANFLEICKMSPAYRFLKDPVKYLEGMNNLHINDFANRLLVDRQYRKAAYKETLKNGNYIFDCTYGNIDPDILARIIHKARMNRKIKFFLSEILFYVNRSSISDANLTALLRFRKYRYTYMSAISHSNLAFHQLQVINNQSKVPFEAFAKMFDYICEHSCFCEEDMIHFLEKTKKNDITPRIVEICIDSAKEKYENSSKFTAAVAWAGQFRDCKTSQHTQARTPQLF